MRKPYAITRGGGTRVIDSTCANKPVCLAMFYARIYETRVLLERVTAQ